MPEKTRLTAEQRDYWDQNGFLILPSFFAEDAVEAVLGIHAQVWRECPRHVIVDNLAAGGRTSMDQLSHEAKRQPHKVNDLYLSFAGVRRCALDQKLTLLLGELLGDTPVLCNTLSLDYGTGQEMHADSLYMTPPRESGLVATWTALEDCHPDAGPLSYLPGSHRIPPYRFSSGRLTEVAGEHAAWENYIGDQIARLNLVEHKFLPRKGDVFVWHGQLLHGGARRNDPDRTRRSLVCHYFTAEASRSAGYKLVAEQGGYWMQRPAQNASTARRAAARSARALRQACYRLGKWWRP
jgi:ectoine hydroxylase-related dioxygenase (phytanoyl-CoA dioxygenase family)